MIIEDVQNLMQSRLNLGNYSDNVKACNDTFTVTIYSTKGENEGDFSDRVNNVSRRLRLKFTVVEIVNNFQLSPARADIEFF